MKADIFHRDISQGGCLVFETLTNSFKSQWHSHSEYELVFIKKGHGVLKYGASSLSYQQGDLFLFGPWIPHEFIDKSNNHHSISCIFLSELLSLQSFKCNMAKNISTLLEKSIEGVHFKNDSDALLATTNFFIDISKKSGIEQAIQLILFLKDLSEQSQNYIQISNTDNHQKNACLKKYALLQNILKYIQDNISQEILIEDITKAFFISRGSLVRLFSDTIQTGVTQYIIQQRLFYACQLLSTTNMPITDIGEKVGFKSISSFNRSFLKYKTMSPRSYRQNQHI
ncbi:AraC family transcriptional regulator [Ignatzschineria sp. LJL83]